MVPFFDLNSHNPIFAISEYDLEHDVVPASCPDGGLYHACDRVGDKFLPDFGGVLHESIEVDRAYHSSQRGGIFPIQILDTVPSFPT
jgi:hypothetical protein